MFENLSARLQGIFKNLRTGSSQVTCPSGPHGSLRDAFQGHKAFMIGWKRSVGGT